MRLISTPARAGLILSLIALGSIGMMGCHKDTSGDEAAANPGALAGAPTPVPGHPDGGPRDAVNRARGGPSAARPRGGY